MKLCIHINIILHSMQCLYCEKTFRDKTTLKDHMRKKQHRRINARNNDYDRFYIINYLVCPCIGFSPEQINPQYEIYLVPVYTIAGVGEDMGGGAVWRWQGDVWRWRWVRPSSFYLIFRGHIFSFILTPDILQSPQRLVGLAGPSRVCRVSVLWAASGDNGENVHTHGGKWYHLYIWVLLKILYMYILFIF